MIKSSPVSVDGLGVGVAEIHKNHILIKTMFFFPLKIKRAYFI